MSCSRYITCTPKNTPWWGYTCYKMKSPETCQPGNTKCMGNRGRVGKSVTNSTDKIFELEILAHKIRAKIRINVQKWAKKCKILQKCAKVCKNKQKFAKMRKNTINLCKNAQSCAKNCVKIQKISTAGKNRKPEKNISTSTILLIHLSWPLIFFSFNLANVKSESKKLIHLHISLL